MDTIYALASAPGKSGVAVIRVSGPSAPDAAKALAGSVPEARKADLRILRDADGAMLDQALVLVFEEGASFTGERVVEFHTHGSIAIQRAVLRALSQLPGFRLAEPGEFTRRALENQKLDLTQVEALSDLIEAQTESQRVQAMQVLVGRLGERVEEWRRRLITAASLLEATIDFADEDLPVDVTEDVRDHLESVLKDLRVELKGSVAAERIRLGFEVAIVGAPNIGKSSLLNELAGRDAAITSEIAGTTRDVIEVHMEIAGLPVTLLDTAGLRETDDPVEKIGIQRARQRAESADLRVFLVGPDEAPMMEPKPGDLVRISKADLTGASTGISVKTGQGIGALVEEIGDVLSSRTRDAGLITRERHRIAFREGTEALETAISRLDLGPAGYDITAEEVRFSIRRLEALIGRVDVESLLDEIFSTFCLGK
ncbi:tRNA uridine-5-carboxymethylaminomethyl(34) synthesis GTPase MnmE [Salipiger sp.]|uniref:tRNA uridine-5-carboxymethylaminomethyl(34) synthesis GTPase MnmE n=1 Tax=Salipiger sp. TaxID=2078585 RepID=UPI003A9835CA